MAGDSSGSNRDDDLDGPDVARSRVDGSSVDVDSGPGIDPETADSEPDPETVGPEPSSTPVYPEPVSLENAVFVALGALSMVLVIARLASLLVPG